MKYLRLSRATFRIVANRKFLPPDFVLGVSQWLLHCGLVLFETGQVYGLVKTNTVENWPRSSSKSIEEILKKIGPGTFDFSELEGLMEGSSKGSEDKTPSRRGRPKKTRSDDDED